MNGIRSTIYFLVDLDLFSPAWHLIIVMPGTGSKA
jgi:hypothetical protein